MADEQDVLAGAMNDALAGIEEPENELNLLGDFAKELLGDDPPAGDEVSEESGKEEAEETSETDASAAESEEEEEEEKAPEESGKEEAEEEEVPEDPPKGTSKKASEDWKKLRGSRDKYKTEATELKEAVTAKEQQLAELQAKVTELEELRGKAALSAEMEEKLKNYEELERTVATLRVEESPEFKTAVAEPLRAIETQAEALGKENEADINAIFDALAEPDPVKQRSKLKEVTAGWDEIDKVELRNMAADTRTLLNKQREMREHAHEAAKERERLAAEESEKQIAARRKEFEGATKNVIGQLKEKVPFVPLRDGETAEDRFAAVAEKLSKVDFDSNSSNDKAFAAAAALVLPSMIRTVEKLQKELAAYEKRLDSKNSTKPGASKAEPKPVEDEEDFFKALGIRTLDASAALNVTG